ncbi:MAG: YjjG family noncanonical pyrimidine nucleotidase [Clostridia bacterium]|nr:YjjG family noncanonical pyrimidine nucleotidase [Clostridia bacterium]
MLTTVFFDVDDTLLDFKKAELVALSSTLTELGFTPTEAMLERYHVINRSQWELLERGELTREQVLRRRFTLFFEEYGLPCDVEKVKSLYEHLLGVGHYFMPGAPELLKTLHRQYDLYLMTNGTASIQRRRLDSAGILPYFKDVFISHEIGFNKPDPRYFEHCFSSIDGFEKEKAVIVGDSPSSDIRGGNLVGLRTCWFNPSHSACPPVAKPDFEVDSLYTLPALLAKL